MSNGDISQSCADSESGSVICASVQTFHLSANTSIAVVKTKIKSDSHANTCIVCDHCLIVHDHKRPGHDPKAGSKCAPVVDATVAYTVPETDQFVLSINQAIKMKGLDHHLLCPMQCHVNGVMIDEVPKFLAPVTSETMHSIQIENPFDATNPIIIPLKLNGVTSYLEVRTPTQEEYEY